MVEDTSPDTNAALRVRSGRSAEKVERDLRVVSEFVGIFCREKHAGQSKETVAIKDPRAAAALGAGLSLCPDCARLVQHAAVKLISCPQDPKPMCKKCTIHCYAPWYRERIREVMKFSGMYLIKHGRVDLMMHYFA